MSFKNKFKSFFTGDNEYEYEYMEEDEEVGSLSGAQDENVVSLTALQQAASKVVLCEPRSYNEAQDIADHVINRRSVVVNLQLLDHDKAKRIIDFLSGTVYALNGDIQKLGSQTFLCTPDNVDVSGSISETFQDPDQFDKGW